MKLNINDLEKCFYDANQMNKKYIGVKIEMYGFKNPEIIINPNINFDKKFYYYRTAYNEDLTLRNAPDKIKIIGFAYGNTFEEIKKMLLV